MKAGRTVQREHIVELAGYRTRGNVHLGQRLGLPARPPPCHRCRQRPPACRGALAVWLPRVQPARVGRLHRGERWRSRTSGGAPSLAREEGITEGQARAILALLAARGVSVTTAARAQIEACKDAATLDRWIVRAARLAPPLCASTTRREHKWAYFFREAKNLEVVPPALSEGPFAEALEIARKSSFTDAEWLEYERSKMAEQDERGAISLARQEGHKEGHKEGELKEAARAVLAVLRARSIVVPETARERILGEKELVNLERWLEKAATAPSIADVLDEPS